MTEHGDRTEFKKKEEKKKSNLSATTTQPSQPNKQTIKKKPKLMHLKKHSRAEVKRKRYTEIGRQQTSTHL